MCCKEPTDGMKRYYEGRKAETIKKVTDAIDEMLEWNEVVTKKELMRRTGLSSGTFSKPYVLEVLKDRKVCQFAVSAVNSKEEKERLRAEENDRLKRENKALLRRAEDAESRVVKLKGDRAKQDERIKELESKVEHLVGTQQMLLERLDVMTVGHGDIVLCK